MQCICTAYILYKNQCLTVLRSCRFQQWQPKEAWQGSMEDTLLQAALYPTLAKTPPFSLSVPTGASDGGAGGQAVLRCGLCQSITNTPLLSFAVPLRCK